VSAAGRDVPGERELAVLALFHALLQLSPDDGDRAALVTLRLPNARLVGDVWLSERDTDRLTQMLTDDALASGSLRLDESLISNIGDEAERYLREGGDA
jgi:hypothetical protein